MLDPLAYLVRVVTRLCLDVLASPRLRRVDHVGYRLPEPARTDVPPLGPLETVEQRDTLSLALLDLLGVCSPPERAAWVLHEAFCLPFAQIAAVLDVTPAAARQLASRAGRRIARGAPSRLARPTRAQRQAVLQSFLGAVASGDVQQLAAVLTADAVVYSDGGGRRSAARRPVVGRDRVARFLLGIAGRAGSASLEVLEMTGGPVLAVILAGVATHIFEVDPGESGIAAVRIACDPLALSHPALLARP